MKTFTNFINESRTIEPWSEQEFGDGKNTYSVKAAYDAAKKHGKLIKDFPINKTDGLEWWHNNYSMDNPAHKKRMETADTSVPILGTKQPDGTISVADGLNRVMKAHHLEKKTHISAWIVDLKHVKPKEKLDEVWDFVLEADLSKKRSQRYSALSIDGEVVETHHSHKHIESQAKKAKLNHPNAKISVHGPIDSDDRFQMKKGQRI